MSRGIFAAFAIITLSVAREHDSTKLIIFYLMAIGTVCNALLMAPVFVMPGKGDLPLLVGSGIMGIMGTHYARGTHDHRFDSGCQCVEKTGGCRG